MPGAQQIGLLNKTGKALAAAGLICFAALAILSGTDRQSREFPTSPNVVGWPYDSGAARAKAILAFVNTGPGSAIPLARRAILSDPVSAPAVSILGRSQLYAGQFPEARKTFEVAGQLGWRDGMTQIYWLDQALRVADYKTAAERLDALLRQAPQDESGARFLAVMSATPEGRDALAKRLKLGPNWANAYLVDLKDVPQDQLLQRVDVVRRTGRSIWDCRTSAIIVQNLIKANLLDEAQTIWRLNCAVSASLVYDGSFDQLDTTKPTTGFDWILSERGDAGISLTQDETGHRMLNLQVNATVALPVVRQLVVLKPGTYRLRWRSPGTAANATRAMRVALSCTPRYADALASSESREPGVFVNEFVVDAQCSARQLIFWLAPQTPVNLDDVALERL